MKLHFVPRSALITMVLFIRIFGDWEQSSGIGGLNVNFLYSNQLFVFASTDSGYLYLTNSHGRTWTNLGTVLGKVTSMATIKQNVFAASDKGIHVSSDSGYHWKSANNNLVDSLSVKYLLAIDTQLLAATGNGAIYASLDNGTSWNSVITDLPSNLTITSLIKYDTTIFIGTNGTYGIGGVFRSTNNALNWLPTNSGFPSDVWVTAIAALGTKVFAGTYGDSLYVSSDNGANWSKVESSVLDSGYCNYVSSIVINGPRITIGVMSPDKWGVAIPSGVYSSLDSGKTWTPINRGLPYTSVKAMASCGNYLFAGTDNFMKYLGNVYISQNNGNSWTSCLPRNQRISSIQTTGGSIFIGLQSGNGGVYISKDSGVGWKSINQGLPYAYHMSSYPWNYYEYDVSSLAISGTIVLASSSGGISGISKLSTDQTQWISVGPGTDALTFNGSDVYASSGASIYWSHNSGSTWTTLSSLVGTGSSISSIVTRNSSLIVGEKNLSMQHTGGIFISTDTGKSWTAHNTGLSADSSIYSILISANNLIAATNQGIYVSTNNADNWNIATGLPQNTIVNSLVQNTSIALSGTNRGIFLSTDNGLSWDSINSGLPSEMIQRNIVSLCMGSTTIFAGTDEGVFWKRPVSEVADISNKPIFPIREKMEIKLLHMNGNSVLSYTTTTSGQVQLRLFKIDGKLVVSLSNGLQQPGSYSVRLSNRLLPGLFICKLSCGSLQKSNTILVAR